MLYANGIYMVLSGTCLFVGVIHIVFATTCYSFLFHVFGGVWFAAIQISSKFVFDFHHSEFASDTYYRDWTRVIGKIGRSLQDRIDTQTHAWAYRASPRAGEASIGRSLLTCTPHSIYKRRCTTRIAPSRGVVPTIGGAPPYHLRCFIYCSIYAFFAGFAFGFLFGFSFGAGERPTVLAFSM